MTLGKVQALKQSSFSKRSSLLLRFSLRPARHTEPSRLFHRPLKHLFNRAWKRNGALFYGAVPPPSAPPHENRCPTNHSNQPVQPRHPVNVPFFTLIIVLVVRWIAPPSQFQREQVEHDASRDGWKAD